MATSDRLRRFLRRCLCAGLAAILLLLPFATVGMIFRLFFRPKIAFRIAVLFALAMAMFIEPMGLILPYCLLGSVLGVQVLQHSKRRSR